MVLNLLRYGNMPHEVPWLVYNAHGWGKLVLKFVRMFGVSVW